jgi:phage shock protein PspC (stress-responsive transcriptional regulator)
MGPAAHAAQDDGVETTTPPPPPAPPFRRPPLHRSRRHRVLGGVAAGIAETYGLDVALVRVLWVIAAVAWIGVPAYVIAWIAIPEEGSGPEPGDPVYAGLPSNEIRPPGLTRLFTPSPRGVAFIVALVFIGAGIFVAVNQVIPWSLRTEHISAPLLLIGAGVAILLVRSRETIDPEPLAATEAIPVVQSPASDDASDEATDSVPGDGDSDVTTETPTSSAWTQSAEWPTTPPSYREIRRSLRRKRPRPFLTPIALSVLLIGAGVTSFLQSIDAIDVNLTVAFAIATCFVGAVLVLSTWIGRAHGLIAVGVLLACATAVSSTIDVPLHGGFGDRTYQPVTASELQSSYQLSAGSIHLDLRQLPDDATRDLRVTVGFGEINVDVPSTVTVDVDAKAGAGNIELFGHTESGWHVNDKRIARAPGAGRLHLDLHVGAGHIVVRRWDTSNDTILGGP